MERRQSPTRGARPSQPTKGGATAAWVTLIEAGLDTDLARKVAQGTALQDLFLTDSTLGKPRAARAVVAFVGPPGSGKTTTLVKLASRYGLTCKKPAHILTADVHRIAAASQLRTLSAILGIGFDVVETPRALLQSLEEHKGKDLIFIDTPGLGLRDLEDAQDLACVIADHPEIDTHLVLPAFAEPGDLARFSQNFQSFEPDKLLFTRLDETERYGALISEAARLGLPISFLGNGQSIPDDLEPATNQLLAGLLLDGATTLGPHAAHGSPQDSANRRVDIQPKRIGASA